MNKRIVFLTISIIFILLLNIFSPIVYAVTDRYNFTSNENNNIQGEDQFTYRNDCFERSSFLGCSHLETLSAQVAEASVSWYGEGVDKYEVDPSNNPHNLIDMLEKMGFENVTTNSYYTLEKEENSVGIAVGSRKITVDDKEYTLLAIIPRSAGYKQEWAGNFTVGDGDVHEGFKAARDEALRFVKKYINDNGINGNLKVWTAGHSRGAATANMIGGFFAGGGIEYFGNSVSITPEDVYCYTYATPRPIKDGASKNVVLSVAANRLDEDYANDTPGEAFNYTKGGTVDINSEEYKGIRNFISPNDIFPLLPPEDWGFACYGTSVSVDHGVVTEEDMLAELATISEYAYNKYNKNGNPNSFERKTFDLKTLSIVKDDGNYSAMDFKTFLKERLKGLTYNAENNKEYKDDNYQEALKSIAGVYGMGMTLFDSGVIDDVSSIISPLIFSYLSYASERLQEENRAASDEEAVAIVLADLLSYFTEEEIDIDTFTIDDFIVLLAKYISDNEDEPVANALVSGICNLIPEKYSFVLEGFKVFDKDNSEENPVKVEDGVKEFLKACYYGPVPGSGAAENFDSAIKVRGVLYGLAGIALMNDHPEIVALITDSDGELTAPGKFKDLVTIILSMLETVKDENGVTVKTYNSLAEAADDKLVKAIDNILGKVLEKAKNIYGDEYYNKLKNHVDTIKDNISETRRLVLYALLYEDGDFNVESNIKNATTFIGNASILPLAHYNEIYLAYAKSAEKYGIYEDHDKEYICIEGANQDFNKENQDEGNKLSFKYNIDYDTFVREGKVFVDNVEVSRDRYRIDRGSTIITFNDDYTQELSLGEHTINVTTDEGNVEVNFSVSNVEAHEEEENGNEEENEENNKGKVILPNTGDNIILWISILAVSLIVVVGIIVYLKKNKEKNKEE